MIHAKPRRALQSPSIPSERLRASLALLHLHLLKAWLGDRAIIARVDLERNSKCFCRKADDQAVAKGDAQVSGTLNEATAT